MLHRDPHVLRHGTLTVYLKSLEGARLLQLLVKKLPEGRPVVWLDSARHHPATGRWSLLGYDPWLTLVARDGAVEVRTSHATQRRHAHPLSVLDEVLSRYRLPSSSQPQARAIGLMGFFSYECNRWIERLPAPRAAEPSLPDMVWFGMRMAILVDHIEQRTWLLSVVDPHQPRPVARRRAIAALREAEDALVGSDEFAAVEPPTLDPAAEPVHPAAGLQATSTQREFETMVTRALEAIRAGEMFQANLSQRFTTDWRGPSLPLYHTLRRINPSPFACWLSSDACSVVSCSPERLVRVQDGRVDTRPIAGTRPRGATPEDDALQSLELLLSEKERAEHIMLVDLARNDLGRVCEVGSVSVGDLMALEEYSHVIHIVSEVSGTLRRGAGTMDVVRAVFPGGTITGCPKVRCMQIIRELEPVARGLYTGSLGYIGFDGTMDLNIAIRTMVIQGERLSFHVGAGIVADSDPEREYHETLAKAGALVRALGEARALSREPHALLR